MDEKIKRRGLAIYALSQRGESGEKENAKVKLDALLTKHSITINDLIGEKAIEKKYRYQCLDSKHLFLHCVSKLFGDIDVYKLVGTTHLMVNLSEGQHAELKFVYDKYREALDKEKKTLFLAFVNKHQLFSDNYSSNSSKNAQLSKDEVDKVLGMMKNISDVSLRKELSTT